MIELSDIINNSYTMKNFKACMLLAGAGTVTVGIFCLIIKEYLGIIWGFLGSFGICLVTFVLIPIYGIIANLLYWVYKTVILIVAVAIGAAVGLVVIYGIICLIQSLASSMLKK